MERDHGRVLDSRRELRVEVALFLRKQSHLLADDLGFDEALGDLLDQALELASNLAAPGRQPDAPTNGIAFTAGAAGFNLNPGDQVTAFYNF